MKECPQCNSILKKKPDELSSNFRIRRFCSKSCACTFNNKKRKVSQKHKDKVSNTLLFYTEEKIIEIINEKQFNSFSEIRSFSRQLYNRLIQLKKENNKLYLRLSKPITARIKKKKDHFLKQKKEKIKKVALNHKTKKQFIQHEKNTYDLAWRMDKNKYPGFLNEICSHMEPLGSRHSRGIYVIEFPMVNKAYIGLTYNFKTRKSTHTKSSHNPHVRELMTKNEPFEFKELTPYLEVKSSQVMECKFIKEYKDKGWITLNLVRGGGIGG